MNQCGRIVHFVNIICLKKEGSQSTPYTNNVGYLHRSCTLEQAQCSGNDQIGCFARIIVARGVHYLCRYLLLSET